MNGLPYYKRYPRDFIEGTISLPFEVKTTYAFILDLIYMQGGKLPDDARYIAGLLNVSVRKWNSLREQLIAHGKIQLSGEFLTNYRAVSELESLAKLSRKQAENASGPRKNKDLEKPRQNHTEPEPDTEKKEEPDGSSKKRGSRLPDDWQLPKAWGEWALQEGMDEVSVRREADKFRDYWQSAPGSKGVKRDWLATWRNWVRKAVDDRKPRKAANASGYPEIGDERIFNGRLKRYAGNGAGWLVVHD